MNKSNLHFCFFSSHTWALLDFQLINKIIPFRMDVHEELIGADYCEHNIHHPGVGVTRAVSVLKDHVHGIDLDLLPVGKNQGNTSGLNWPLVTFP